MFDFISNKITNCGVHQFGLRLTKILKSEGLDHRYYETDNANDFIKISKKSKIIIFNFMDAGRPTAPLKWLNSQILSSLKSQGHILGVIDHLRNTKFDFDFVIHHNPNIKTLNNLTIPRPLFYDIENVPFTKVNPENIQNLNNKRLVFGSFGMAFESKGFDHIVELINNEFDNALIRFHITISQYNDMEGKKHSSIIDKLRSIKLKEKIDLEINTNFISDDELLNSLNNNDLNILNYKKEDFDDGSLSSAVDHAISARKPFAISSSHQFNHIDRELCLETNSLKNIISKGSKYCDKYLQDWSHKNMKITFENYLKKFN